MMVKIQSHIRSDRQIPVYIIRYRKSETTPREKCLKSFLKYSKIRHSFLRVGFESRLVLSMIQKRRYPLDTSFFVYSSPAGFERFECLRSAAVVAVERPPDVLRRLVLSMIQKRDIRWVSLFLYIQALPGSNGSKVSVLPRACRTADMSASFS